MVDIAKLKKKCNRRKNCTGCPFDFRLSICEATPSVMDVRRINRVAKRMGAYYSENKAQK